VLTAPVEERMEVPHAPKPRAAFSAALNGFYYNSWRLVPANVIWGALALLTLALLQIAPLLGVIVVMLVLPFPTAGVFRLAALIARGEPNHFSDALAWRSFAKRALAAGLVVGGLTIVLGFNVVIGLSSPDPLSWAFATAAFWGLIVLWLVAWAVWPLLFDPLRKDEPMTELIRLALTVILVSPVRYLVLMSVLAVFLVISTILAAAIVTISIAYFALVMAFYAIPGADRIEGRRTFVVSS